MTDTNQQGGIGGKFPLQGCSLGKEVEAIFFDEEIESGTATKACPAGNASVTTAGKTAKDLVITCRTTWCRHNKSATQG